VRECIRCYNVCGAIIVGVHVCVVCVCAYMGLCGCMWVCLCGCIHCYNVCGAIIVRVHVCVVCVCVCVYTYTIFQQNMVHICVVCRYVKKNAYGVASVSRINKMIGLFCKRVLSKRQYSAKETYNLIDPTDRSHPIATFS